MPEKNLLKIFTEEITGKPCVKDTEECSNYQRAHGCDSKCRGYDNCIRYMEISTALEIDPFNTFFDIDGIFNSFSANDFNKFKEKAVKAKPQICEVTKKNSEEFDSALERAIERYQKLKEEI